MIAADEHERSARVADPRLAPLMRRVADLRHMEDAELTRLLEEFGLLDLEDEVCDALADAGWSHAMSEDERGEWWHASLGSEYRVMVVKPYRRGGRNLARVGECGTVDGLPEGEARVPLLRDGRRYRRLIPADCLKVLRAV